MIVYAALKQKQKELSQLEGRYVPIVAKLAPDMDADILSDTVKKLTEIDCDGFVFSNTTTDKSRVTDNISLPRRGGLSGAPLIEPSTRLLKVVIESTDKPVISVGGIMSAEDALKRFSLGASLVQVYTGLIYTGPKLVGEILKSDC